MILNEKHFQLTASLSCPMEQTFLRQLLLLNVYYLIHGIWDNLQLSFWFGDLQQISKPFFEYRSFLYFIESVVRCALNQINFVELCNSKIHSNHFEIYRKCVDRIINFAVLKTRRGKSMKRRYCLWCLWMHLHFKMTMGRTVEFVVDLGHFVRPFDKGRVDLLFKCCELHSNQLFSGSHAHI